MTTTSNDERASFGAPALVYTDDEVPDFIQAQPYEGQAYIAIMGTVDGSRGGRAERVVKAWVTVDEEDFPFLAQFTWVLTSTGYALAQIGGRKNRMRLRMHRLLLGLTSKDKRQVDHIDQNKLNNRKANLRIVDHDYQNKQNVPGRGGTSSHRGVSWLASRGKWEAQAKTNGRKFHRYFDSEEEAAAAVSAWRAENMPFSTS